MTGIIITGACGGIGRALARALLDQGETVGLWGLDREILDGLHVPGRSQVHLVDVTDAAAMRTAAAEWVDEFGAPAVVIANAGVAGGFDTTRAEDLAVFRRMIDINLTGAVTTFHSFLPAMLDAQTGTLVGIASVAGWRGMPGNGAYSASKGALIRYLESLRAELRPTPLRVLTISPGYVRTALTAGNTMAMPGIIDADTAAQQIIRALRGRRDQVAVPWQTGALSRVLGLLPARRLDSILNKQPRKPRPSESGATAIPGLDGEGFRPPPG